MNEERAKFILSAYRPGHEDREDPEFREALEFARENPEVAAWFEEQVEFDRSAMDAVAGIPVPEDLRDRIMAGGRVSVSSRTGWTEWVNTPMVRAVAAVIVIGLFAAVASVSKLDKGGTGYDAALAAITDLSERKTTLDLKSTDSAAIRAWLNELEPDLVEAYPVAMDEVGTVGCKRVHSEDGLVTIVCFKHDGRMFHLASYRVPEGGTAVEGHKPMVERTGKWLAATWSRGRYRHTLLTEEGGVEDEALLRVIDELNV